MKHKLLIAAALATLMAVPSVASAQLSNADDSGWYVRGQGGYGIHEDTDIEDGIIGDVESEGNGAFSVGTGYDFGNNWRVELDGLSLFTDLGAIDQADSSFANIRTNGGFVNALYDFSDLGAFKPYVGAGVGVVNTDATIVAHDFFNSDGIFTLSDVCTGPQIGTQSRTCDVNDSETGFGWQLLAGMGFDVTNNLTWDTQYRYFDPGSANFDGTSTNAITGAVTPINVEIEDVGGHVLLTGLRYRFGGSTPPPPPPPAPVPVADYTCWDGSVVFNAGQCPAQVLPEPAPAPVPSVRCWDGSAAFTQGECPAQPQTYTCWDGSLVYDLNTCPVQVQTRSNETVASLCGNQFRQEIIYYEFNKGQSAETRNTINRILDVGEFCNVDNIRVIGHTDTSGSAAYNLALSKRRAADAREELVRQGINQRVISSEGKGETEPFVETGDGVKEQLNRRTEVLITLSELGGIN